MENIFDLYNNDQTKFVKDDRSDYTIKRTCGGTTRYFKNDKFVKQKDVPKEIRHRLEFLLHGWSSLYASTLDDRSLLELVNSSKTTDSDYSYKDFGTSIQYYKDGVRIPKRCIPPWVFENMRDSTREWSYNFWKYAGCSRKHYSYSEFPDETQKPKEEPKEEPKDYKSFNISVYFEARSFLNEQGITDRKSWKKWMLKNHPDKNPDFDIELVQLVNGAIDLVYPE